MNHRAISIITVKQANQEQRILKGLATSPAPDRVGDSVDQYGITVAAGGIPLCLYHDTTKVVGRATFGAPTSKGLPFEARLPRIAEPSALKDRVDEAWAMVSHGLITAVSIGFRVVDGAFERMKSGGIRFLKTEILELSLVPCPAQPEAVISGFKSMSGDAQVRALIEHVKHSDFEATARGAKRSGAVMLITAHNPDGLPRGAVRLIPRNR